MLIVLSFLLLGLLVDLLDRALAVGLKAAVQFFGAFFFFDAVLAEFEFGSKFSVTDDVKRQFDASGFIIVR